MTYFTSYNVGTDPATDLRGGGMLSLMNLVSLLTNPRRKVIGLEAYKLSLHPTQVMLLYISFDLKVMMLFLVSLSTHFHASLGCHITGALFRL